MTPVRHVVVVPARNEGRFIGGMLASLLEQTYPPDRIVVVDDGSADDTARIVESIGAREPRVTLVRRPATVAGGWGGGVVAAFDAGYRALDELPSVFISKFDADLVFPPTYCEVLLSVMESRPEVGAAGGTLADQDERGLVPFRTPPGHIVGGLKTYRREIFNAMGGFLPVSGWDIIDLVQVRRLGYQTVALPDLVVKHMRPHGAAKGMLAGRVHWGKAAYVIGSHPLFVLGRGVYRMWERPLIVGGLAFWLGYLGAAARRVPQVADRDLVARLRSEQLYRLFHGNRLPPVESPRGLAGG